MLKNILAIILFTINFMAISPTHISAMVIDEEHLPLVHDTRVGMRTATRLFSAGVYIYLSNLDSASSPKCESGICDTSKLFAFNLVYGNMAAIFSDLVMPTPKFTHHLIAGITFGYTLVGSLLFPQASKTEFAALALPLLFEPIIHAPFNRWFR